MNLRSSFIKAVFLNHKSLGKQAIFMFLVNLQVYTTETQWPNFRTMRPGGLPNSNGGKRQQPLLTQGQCSRYFASQTSSHVSLKTIQGDTCYCFCITAEKIQAVIPSARIQTQVDLFPKCVISPCAMLMTILKQFRRKEHAD